MRVQNASNSNNPMIRVFARSLAALSIALYLSSAIAAAQPALVVVKVAVEKVAVEKLALVPKPVQMKLLSGAYIFESEITVRASHRFSEPDSVLARLLGPASGIEFVASAKAGTRAAAGDGTEDGTEQSAAITIDYLEHLGSEAYELDVTQQGVHISAASDAGVFYAVQTLRQLLPADIYRTTLVQREWSIPAVSITDEPRFRWRGMHLDVGRHFMPVEFVKKFVDLLAVHKLNTFHWHLTEDQGWRIEIKRYPKLTQVGSMRAQTVTGNSIFKDDEELEYDGLAHGGYYTQDEVRAVVAYAAQRHINVVPEIEFPGHAGAAIASYPELGNTGAQLKVMEKWGINKNTLKPSQETLEFYRNVLSEVVALFPSKYIHIGGDEAPKDQWQESEFAQQRIAELGLADEHELQSWMIGQMDKFLAANGRKLIGWDEIMEGGLSETAAVMSWRGMKPGLRAAAAGHDVVMAPTRWTYFDYYQADSSAEPLAIGFYTPLSDVYAFDPAPADLPDDTRRHILGAQGQLWTEFMPNSEHVEYMAFPRAVALSEVLWSPQDTRNYADFQARLPAHLQRLDTLQVNYRPLGNDEQSLGGRLETFLMRTAMEVYFWLNQP